MGDKLLNSARDSEFSAFGREKRPVRPSPCSPQKTVLVLHKRKTDQRRRSSISGVQNWHAPNRGLKFVKQTYSHITAIVRCAGLSCRSTLSRQGRLPALSGRSTNAHDAAVRPVEAAIGAERSILLPETSTLDVYYEIRGFHAFGPCWFQALHKNLILSIHEIL